MITGKTNPLLRWVPLVLVVLWALVPLLHSLSTSFKSSSDYLAIPPRLVPSEPTLVGYRRALGGEFWHYAKNSAIVAVVATVLTVGIASLAAYGFARWAFRWRHLLLVLILIPRLVPRISLIVPLFDMVRALGLYDTRVALIVIYTGAALPLATWIMIGFIGSIPRSLDEAARVDGANSFGVLVRIILPLAIPGLLTIVVLTFRECWNEFPFVLALTSSNEIRTLPYQLFLYKDSIGVTDISLVQASTLLSIVPIVALYVVLERYVIQGITTGAVK